MRKHAKASNLWLTVTVEPPRAHITILDDGQGLKTGRGRPNSFGITGMRERARRIGATLLVSPTAQGGTLVEVGLSLAPSAVHEPLQAPRPVVTRSTLTDPHGIPTLVPQTTRHGANPLASATGAQLTSTTATLRVVLVDDHQLVREGLRRAFDRAGDIQVVGEGASIAEALSALERLKPDVLVIDVRLPDGNGINLTKQVRAGNPTMGIVVLTMYAGDDQVFAALDAGASGFVGKDAPAEEVVAVWHAAANPALSPPATSPEPCNGG